MLKGRRGRVGADYGDPSTVALERSHDLLEVMGLHQEGELAGVPALVPQPGVVDPAQFDVKRLVVLHVDSYFGDGDPLTPGPRDHVSGLDEGLALQGEVGQVDAV